jgi:hypothetical protein
MPTEVKGRVLFADRDGGLWIGTNGDGFVHIQHGPVHMSITADGALCAAGGGNRIAGCRLTMPSSLARMPAQKLFHLLPHPAPPFHRLGTSIFTINIR